MYRSLATLLGLGSVAVGAKNIVIDVGEGGGFKFVPNTTTAAVGDRLIYGF